MLLFVEHCPEKKRKKRSEAWTYTVVFCFSILLEFSMYIAVSLICLATICPRRTGLFKCTTPTVAITTAWHVTVRTDCSLLSHSSWSSRATCGVLQPSALNIHIGILPYNWLIFALSLFNEKQQTKTWLYISIYIDTKSESASEEAAQACTVAQSEDFFFFSHYFTYGARKIQD